MEAQSNGPGIAPSLLRLRFLILLSTLSSSATNRPVRKGLAARLRSSEQNRLGLDSKTSPVNDTTACNFACRRDPAFLPSLFRKGPSLQLRIRPCANASGTKFKSVTCQTLDSRLVSALKLRVEPFDDGHVSGCPGGHFALAAGSGRDGIANARRGMRQPWLLASARESVRRSEQGSS